MLVKHSTVVYLILIFVSFYANGQEKALPKQQLLEEGKLLFADSNYNLAYEKFLQVLHSDEIRVSPSKLPEVYAYLGICRYMVEEYKEALYYYHINLSYYQKPSSESEWVEKATTYKNIGMCYRKLSEFDSATVCFIEAIPILENSKDTHNRKVLADVFNQLGNTFRKLKKDNEAISYLEKSLAIFKEQEDTLSMGKCYHNIAISLKNQDRLEESRKYYQKALSMKKTQGASLASTLSNIGAIHFDWQQYDSAIFFYEKAIALRKKKKGRSYAITMNNLAETYTMASQLAKADTLLEVVLEEIKEKGFADVRLEYLQNRAMLSFLNTKPKEGKQFLNQYHKLKNEIYSDEMASRVADAETKYKSDILKAKNEKQRVVIYGVGILSALGILVSIFFIQSYRLKKKAYLQEKFFNEKLQSKNEDIQLRNQTIFEQNSLLEEQKATIQTIKESLEHDLANDLLNMRNIALFPLDKLSGKQQTAKFEKYQNRLLAMVQFYQLLIFSNESEENNMKHYILELYDCMCKKYSRTNPDFELILQTKQSQMHKDTQRLLTDIATELFQNMLKYAFPESYQHPKVILSIKQEKEQYFIIRYEDNGQGFQNQKDRDTSRGMRLLRRIAREDSFSCGNNRNGGAFVELEILAK